MTKETVMIKKYDELNSDQIAAILAEVAAGKAQKVISDEMNVALSVVKMVVLKAKRTATDKQIEGEGTGSQGTVATGNTETGDTSECGEEDARKAKLKALKSNVQATVSATTEAKPKRERAKRAPVDTTKRDVIVAHSASEKLAWVSGNIGYVGKDDKFVTEDLLRTAAARKGEAADRLKSLANAEDLVITRESGVLVEEHEAMMAGHWDRLEASGAVMIGRRPKGFKKVAAPSTKPRKQKDAADAPSVDQSVQAKLDALKAKKQPKVEGVEPVAAEEPKVDAVDAVDATEQDEQLF